MTSHRIQNLLLRTLGEEDYALLAQHLSLITLNKGDEITLPETRIRHSWFPISGIISVVAATASGTQAEVGIVGREGMVSVATIHGVDIEMMHIFVQVSGQALRMPVTVLRELLPAHISLHQHLLGYAQNFMVQVASSALAYATQTIESRLARWLLMSLDRLDTYSVNMTHEAFALMLGVRRAGVTVAIQALEAKGAVTSRRATVTIANPAVLAEIAGDSYGSTERAYQRVFGVPMRHGQKAVSAPASDAA